ncbi:hypothetical protein NPX13_g6320 [Xylaria arbuscula]|uniref:Uncharacterized protein n=1 Tax=Xylaria arbuscula TaxID=114810 RepID=A0A9W8NC25_9PEZI|nr:hypothetical protein NPX13_g6320 [Xylaria arbuscula]
MATDSDPPMYALIDDVYGETYEMTHETSPAEQRAPLTPMSQDEQTGDIPEIKQKWSFFHGWAPELLSLFFSAACLTAISILLVVYHGHPVTSLPAGITLNTVVAILTAIYKTALLYTVSSAIGQSKWNMFSAEDRRLRDFERIDEAGKSLRGALSALINIPRSITSLGAIIVILAFLIDPFAQQLINTVPFQVTIESEMVWTKLFTNFNIPLSEDEIPDIGVRPFSVQLNSAFWGNASLYDRQAHCTTGNCTFPRFAALQWCAKTETIDLDTVTTNCTTGDEASIFSEIHHYQLSTGAMKTEHRTCGYFLDGEGEPLTTVMRSFIVGTGAEVLSDYSEASDDTPILIVNNPVESLSVNHGWAWRGGPCDDWLNITCPPLVLSYLSTGYSNTNGTTVLGIPVVLEQSVLTLCDTELDVRVNSGRTETTQISSQYGQFTLRNFSADEWNEPRTTGEFCFTPGGNTLGQPSAGASDNINERRTRRFNQDLSFCWSLSRPGSDSQWWIFWLDALRLSLQDKTFIEIFGEGEGIQSTDMMSRVS